LTNHPLNPSQGTGPRRYSLKWSLAAVVLACILPALAIVSKLVYDAYRLREETLENTTLLVAKETLARLERELASIEYGLKLLATDAALREGNLQAFQKRADDALPSTTVYNFILTDRNGHQKVNTLIPFGRPLPTTGTPPALADVFVKQRTVLTDLFVGPVVQRHALAMGVPVIWEDEVVFSLNIGLEPLRISQLLQVPSLPSGWLIAVLDRSGTIVARTREHDTFVGQKTVPELYNAIRSAPSGILRALTKEGKPVITAFVTSPDWGWTIAVGAPEEDLRGGLVRHTQWGLIGIALALSVGLALAYRVTRRILSSIEQLNRQAQAIVEGKLVEPPRLLVAEAESVAQVLHRAGQAMGAALHQAHHDPLTGLGNRAYMEAHGPRLLSLGKRLKLPVALLMIDLDGFKAVNDRQGHAAGDQVLVEVARRIQALVRNEDLVARLGGDEFCVLLSGSAPDTAQRTAERLVAELSLPYGGIEDRIGASVGIATLDERSQDLPQLMAQADAALYRAKASGKGRVVS
jgi:diguanylate cyclase (GGDEF)-like protein